ncbi:MAG: FAD-dependent oxidoreductase, partial [Bifidobacteriaceae bacterium]|nr:FAD-dependent oxidoreductase [Bifidobacteriaceae bacterium]
KAVKCVRLGSGQEYGAKAVVLATGSAYRHLGVEGEERLTGHGLSYCATCDGAFFRDKVIYVIGGGDSALTEALFLTRVGRTVTVVHRRDQLRASRVLQERAAAQPNLDFAWNSTVSRVIGETAVTALELTDTVNGATREVPADGVFVAIGHEPRTAFLGGQVELDDHGYIVVDGRSSRTSLPGVFACGDAVDHTYRQAITAAAAGCHAALDAQDYLGRIDADAQVAGGTV